MRAHAVTGWLPARGGRGRGPQFGAGAAGLLLAVTLASPLPAEPGRYTARREARGDVTDTAPKLDTWAFFDDSRPTPLGLTLLIDTFAARHALSTRLLPLDVGLGYDGTGPRLSVDPKSLELSFDGGSVRGLSCNELMLREGWQSALNQHRHLLAGRPRPYDPSLAAMLSVNFYPDPPTSAWRSDNVRLSPGTAFTDLVYFELPEGLDPWTTRFVLSFTSTAEPTTAPPAAPLASAAFRIEPDPELHQRAFRHARHAKE